MFGFERCLLFFVKQFKQYLLDNNAQFEEKIDFGGRGGDFVNLEFFLDKVSNIVLEI